LLVTETVVAVLLQRQGMGGNTAVHGCSKGGEVSSLAKQCMKLKCLLHGQVLLVLWWLTASEQRLSAGVRWSGGAVTVLAVWFMSRPTWVMLVCICGLHALIQ
jgi:hypothetical protein